MLLAALCVYVVSYVHPVIMLSNMDMLVQVRHYPRFDIFHSFLPADGQCSIADMCRDGARTIITVPEA